MKITSKALIQKEKALLNGVAQAIGSTLGAAVAKMDRAAKRSGLMTTPKSRDARKSTVRHGKTAGTRARKRRG